MKAVSIDQNSGRKIAGWCAVGISAILTSFWAFWGIIENFHEGWYYESWLSNLGLMIAQYLSPMFAFMAISLISIYWPRLGSALHILFALFAVWFFQVVTNPALFILIAPLAGLGALYWYGRPEPRRIAVVLIIGLPILTLILSGIEPIIRVAARIDDGNLQARLVEGNGVSLVWAPAGPGWPLTGMNWVEAQRVCQYLRDDGLTLAPGIQNIWRLPTVDEAVRSMARRGLNSVGVWDAETARAAYETTPDKESPLWDAHSQVIYWWTATAHDEDQAYMIVYDGRVWMRSKQYGPDYLGFRCVK